MKPLFRYTIGACLQQGLDILVESIRKTTQALGVDNFDWVVCYNALGVQELGYIRKNIGNIPVEFFAQTWKYSPLPEASQSPKRSDGTFEWNGKICGGTLWKVCPPRLRIESHEIVMDNDIVILNFLPQIKEFLSSDKSLILEEPIRFYGHYDQYHEKTPYLNSGFMGFPPGLDFGESIKKVWEECGNHQPHSQADEQGLLTLALNKIPSIRIRKEEIVEVLAKDYNYKITGRELGLHFTQANKVPNHRVWKSYCNMHKNC